MNNNFDEHLLGPFYSYVFQFYGRDGIYPMGATMNMIRKATDTHIKILDLKNVEFAGDSIDREMVRDLLISQNNLSLK